MSLWHFLPRPPWAICPLSCPPKLTSSSAVIPIKNFWLVLFKKGQLNINCWPNPLDSYIMISWDIPPIHFKSGAPPYNWPTRRAGGPSSPFSAPIAGTVDQRASGVCGRAHRRKTKPHGDVLAPPLSWLIGQRGGRLGLRGWVSELVNPDHGEEKDRGGWWGKGAKSIFLKIFFTNLTKGASKCCQRTWANSNESVEQSFWKAQAHFALGSTRY